MFADWDVDVWNGPQRLLSKREQKDKQMWPSGPSCGVDASITVRAHSCSVVNELNLLDDYDLSESLYTVVERPKRDLNSSKPPSRADGLEFQVIGGR